MTKPYQIEIFDRNLNFICNTLIDTINFEYSEDGLSPESNTISIPNNVIPIPTNPNIMQSWYIRIFRNGEEYQGLIHSVTRGKVWDTITYNPLIYLFDDDVRVVTTGILNTASADDYIRDVLKANYVNNADSKQNVPHLVVTSLGNVAAAYATEYTYTESLADWKTRMELEHGLSNGKWENDGTMYYYEIWEFDHYEEPGEVVENPGETPDVPPRKEVWDWHVVWSGNYVNSTTTTFSAGGIAFDYATNSNPWTTISLLDDLLLPAAQVYFIFCDIYIDFQKKEIRCDIGLNEEGKKTIETALPSVIDAEVTIKETTKEINKAVIINTQNMSTSSDGSKTIYYLHSDGKFDTNGNSDRLLPVHTDYETYGNVPSSADSIARSTYQSYLDVFNSYAHVNRKLSDSEYESLIRACGIIMPLLYASGKLTVNVLADESLQAFDNEGSTITVHNKPNGHYEYQVLQSVAGYRDTGYWEREGVYVYMVSHVVLKLDIVEYLTSSSTGTNTEPVDYTCYQDITNNNASDAINFFFSSSTFTQYKELLQKRLTDMYIHQLATKAFIKSKYQNLIEFTVLANDSILEPLNLKMGQVVNVIHDGKSYNSILSGRQIVAGKVKLIFGTIRLELTKYLKGRY